MQNFTKITCELFAIHIYLTKQNVNNKITNLIKSKEM